MTALLLLVVCATSEQRLAATIDLFQHADFARARDAAASIVEDGSLADGDRAEARIYLAASYHALGDVASARLHLMLLARQHPSARVDPVTFLPELVALADEARRQVEAERPAAPAPAAPSPPSRALGVLPFGVGQFVKGEPVKGALFLGAQVALAVVCIAALASFESMKTEGTPFVSGKIRESDRPTAEVLRRLYPVTFFAALSVAIIGIIEAQIGWPL